MKWPCNSNVEIYFLLYAYFEVTMREKFWYIKIIMPFVHQSNFLGHST